MVCFGYKTKVGNRSVTYNPDTKRMWPSDLGFTLCTLTLIIVPTTLCYIYAIIMAETYGTVMKVFVFLVYCVSIYGCLRNLYKCSFTEPGVIPPIEKKNMFKHL